jgi:hypothetical protein
MKNMKMANSLAKMGVIILPPFVHLFFMKYSLNDKGSSHSPLILGDKLALSLLHFCGLTLINRYTTNLSSPLAIQLFNSSNAAYSNFGLFGKADIA